jgi:hypothetical protein
MLKRDSIYFGSLMGLITPLIVFTILYFLLELVEMVFALEWLNERPAVKLISVALNLLLIRYYFARLKFENTGRGLLITTFVYVIAYFIIYPPA